MVLYRPGGKETAQYVGYVAGIDRVEPLTPDDRLREWRSSYPAETSVEFREIRGRGDLWVAEISISYDRGPANFGVSILEFRDGKIARESIYVTEAWEPPEWRARWRAAP